MVTLMIAGSIINISDLFLRQISSLSNISNIPILDLVIPSSTSRYQPDQDQEKQSICGLGGSEASFSNKLMAGGELVRSV